MGFEVRSTDDPAEVLGQRVPSPAVMAVIASGGALGASTRYALSRVMGATPGSFPWATFGINVTGSLAIGFMFALLVRRIPPRRLLRPFLATGFLGGYTTYSTFAVETDLLVKGGHLLVAGAYAITSLVAGPAAVWAGLYTGHGLRRRGSELPAR